MKTTKYQANRSIAALLIPRLRRKQVLMPTSKKSDFSKRLFDRKSSIKNIIAKPNVSIPNHNEHNQNGSEFTLDSISPFDFSRPEFTDSNTVLKSLTVSNSSMGEKTMLLLHPEYVNFSKKFVSSF